MTVSVIAAQNASIRASSSGTGLEIDINAQLATLLSHTILNVQISTSKNPATQGHLQAVVGYQDGATSILTPYVLKLFTGKTLADAGALANAYMASHPSYFFSPLSFSMPDEQRAAAPCVLGLLYNTSYADGLSHFGIGGFSIGQNVRAYGAVGDGVTDDADAIRAAQVAAGEGGSIYFPPSDDAYMIGSSIVPTCSWLSFTRGQVTLRALAGFVGDFMLPCAGGTAYNTYDRIIFDANYLEIHTYGGPLGGAVVDKANRATFLNCKFIANADGYYPIYGEATTVGEQGNITGSVFTNCEFIGLHNWFHLGTSEDDVFFQSCRFMHSYVNYTDFLMYVQGNNNKWVSCYMGFAEQGFTYAGLVVYGAAGSYNITFDQCHLEYGHATTNFIFVSLSPAMNISFRSLRLNLVDCTALQALVSAGLNTDGNGFQKFYEVNAAEKYDTEAYGLLYVYTDASMSSANDTFVTLQFAGCDQFDPDLLWRTQGTVTRSTLDPVKPHGVHRGIHYQPREPGSYYVNSTSPAAITIQLKRPGWCLLSINAYVNGHNQAAMTSGLYWVSWDGVNAGTIGQLGVDQVSPAIAPGSLTVGAPNTTGALSLSFAWTVAANPAFDICVDVAVTLPNQIYNHA